jgi:hypothetical protein
VPPAPGWIAIRLHLTLQVGRDILALASQLEQRIEIRGHTRHFRFFGDTLLQLLAILHHLLRLLGLIPEIGIGDLLLSFS